MPKSWNSHIFYKNHKFAEFPNNILEISFFKEKM